MYNIGDIISRTGNQYKAILLGTRGEVIERRSYAVSRVLVLDGDHKGELHNWADSYVTLELPRKPDWEI